MNMTKMSKTPQKMLKETTVLLTKLIEHRLCSAIAVKTHNSILTPLQFAN